MRLMEKSKKLKSVPTWKENDMPADYLRRFEQVMKCNGEPKDQWARSLSLHLTGKASTVFSTRIPLDRQDDYDAVKSILLDAFGDTVDLARQQWWTLKKSSNETFQDCMIRIEEKFKRGLEGCETRFDYVSTLSLSKFISLLPAECRTYVLGRNPRDGMMAAHLAEEFYRINPWKERSNYNSKHDRRDTVPSKTVPGAGRADQPLGQNKPNLEQPQGLTQDQPRVPICYACGQEGHKKPDCPKSVRRLRSPLPNVSSLYVTGKIGDIECSKMVIDSGATQTTVHPNLIPKALHTGDSILIHMADGSPKECPLAKVWLHLGDRSVQHEVAVLKTGNDDAILGLDLHLHKYLLQLEEEQTTKQATITPVRVTRKQAVEDKEQECLDDAATAQSGVKPVQLSEIMDFDDSLLQDGKEPIQATPDAEEDVLQLPLPAPLKSDDRALLIQQQMEDDSLASVRKMADQLSNGYKYEEGIVIHEEIDEMGTAWKRIVVPQCRRPSVLSLAHSNCMGGHLGIKKTVAKIRRHFTWPGISKDIKTLCTTCPQCQMAARNDKGKAPLIPLPVITVPFSRLAFDVVGPLPRTKSGYKYILTCMCYATKYPEAIPLKKVDAQSVAEAMVEVFSRTGLPNEVLTDQGGVFLSALCKQMCKLLQITTLRTSPYHPQTDGMLERWHASLKSMLKKAQGDRNDWDKYLKFLLFAYRSTPHSATGFTPFELIYGRDVRGPLEMLKLTWLDGALPEKSLNEWVQQLKDKMEAMSQLASSRERVAKNKMKSAYDQKAKPRSFDIGSMVLMRVPGLTGKLDDSWEGPYEVVDKISSVNYQLAIPGRTNKARVVHVNMLRQWHTPDARVLRLVVADEDEEEGNDHTNGGEESYSINSEQKEDLEELLNSYADVINPTPGRVTLTHHAVNTKDSPPLKSAPYRLAPAWKDQLKAEVKNLAEAGIIQPSTSPWSSPIIPVRKKDGSVRLCVDFRRINKETVPDPYLMPRVEEIIDCLGEAKYLSVLDLNKGFHQVPMKPEDVEKTAFCTPWGKYEYLFMPFGLRNAPSTFQRLMDQVLHDMLDFSRAYIDDIVIFSSTWTDHLQHLKSVLDRLREVGLTAKPSKCAWARASCVYLGYLVGGGRVTPEECKVAAVKNFLRPLNKSDIRSYLGLTGYYRKFIPDYASHSVALTAATRKTAPSAVEWSQQLEEEFLYLKQALCRLPSLTIPTQDDSFLLQTDASAVGIGAVLSVVRDNVEKPVAFFSRKMLPREQRYSATEAEGLAVVEAVDHFAVYLIGKHFIIETDHKALEFLNSYKSTTGRLARWALRLQPFTFTVVHRAGSKNGNADGLSRQAWSANQSQ